MPPHSRHSQVEAQHRPLKIKLHVQAINVLLVVGAISFMWTSIDSKSGDKSHLFIYPVSMVATIFAGCRGNSWPLAPRVRALQTQRMPTEVSEHAWNVQILHEMRRWRLPVFQVSAKHQTLELHQIGNTSLPVIVLDGDNIVNDESGCDSIANQKARISGSITFFNSSRRALVQVMLRVAADTRLPCLIYFDRGKLRVWECGSCAVCLCGKQQIGDSRIWRDTVWSRFEHMRNVFVVSNDIALRKKLLRKMKGPGSCSMIPVSDFRHMLRHYKHIAANESKLGHRFGYLGIEDIDGVGDLQNESFIEDYVRWAAKVKDLSHRDYFVSKQLWKPLPQPGSRVKTNGPHRKKR